MNNHSPKRTFRPLLPTPANDAVVREAYTAFRERNDRSAIINAAAKLGCEKWMVNRRGRDLGLARTKEKPWSDEELALLEEWAWMGPDRISLKLKRAGFSRSPCGVLLKRKRLKLLANLDGYSQHQLCGAFGVDHHVIERWRVNRWLIGHQRGTARTEANGGDIYYFPKSFVRSFVIRHPEEVDLCKVEKFWFLELLTEGEVSR